VWLARRKLGMSLVSGVTVVSDLEISDWDYIMSALGNAYFSGMTLTEVWDCVRVSSNREEFDLAVSTNLRLKELLSDEK
jgi:hypothetical protein